MPSPSPTPPSGRGPRRFFRPWMGPAPLLGTGLLLLLTCQGKDSGSPGTGPSTPTPPANCAPVPASSLVVNVKDAPYGAKGDGLADDTAAIQRAVNAVGGTGGTVLIPAGTYRIDALTSILLRSDMTLSMASGAVLAAIPNGADNYTILRVSGVSNVNIVGGTLLGERSAHTGTTGEQGMGLRITGNAQHIAVAGVTAKECWGDGFMVADASDVSLCGLLADHNRRQGLSITGGKGVVVKNSTFTRTGGTLPEDGLDIEPNSGQTVDNVLITGCTFSNNAGDGIETGVPISLTGSAFITRVVIDGNTLNGNGAGSLSHNPRSGIEVSNTGGHTVRNNTVQGNAGYGIYLRNGVTGTTVTRNTVTQNGLNGILEYLSSGNTITDNTLSGNGVPP